MVIYPPPLKKGDAITVIAPAGSLAERSRYYTGCRILTEMGFIVSQPDKQWPAAGYLAGTDQQRLHEMHQAWQDMEIKGIITLRGGFGSLRLLDRIDFKLIRENPKVFVGFSDITILHAAIQARTGLVSFHGPVLTSLATCDHESHERFFQCLTGSWHQTLQPKLEVVRSGPPVRGTLLGGNLSSLVSLLGTSWAPDFSGCILFLEDVNEPVYRLDRLLTQLHLSGSLDGVAGIICGDFSGADETDRNEELRRHEFIWHRVGELTGISGIPVWGAFPAGHRARNLTLPIGARAAMDSSSRTLTFSIY